MEFLSDYLKLEFMKKLILLTALLAMVSLHGKAANIIYTKNDSVRAEAIIREAARQPAGTNTIVFIGRKLLGVPYVAQTLEKGKKESLVINTTQLDCTTFVENVLAMYLCVKNKKHRFADFCNYLRTVRYDGGKVGYTSRLHYFSTWIVSNTAKGLVTEQSSPVPPFSATQTIKANFMSTHADRYPMLNGNDAYLKEIAKAEKSITGKTVRYIPTSLLNNSKLLKKAVKDGDIIGLVTKKAGLEISHVGYAVWHKDGKLHLMNASSLEHKVIDDKQSLYKYMKNHPSNLGIRVIRVK